MDFFATSVVACAIIKDKLIKLWIVWQLERSVLCDANHSGKA
jgi:hypothetical protein